MNVLRIDEISPVYLSTSFKTSNGVGLCYFDPSDELLKEFTSDVVLPIYPGEESKRQFYIVKDDTSLIFSTLTFKASVENPAYVVKTSLDYNADFSSLPDNNSIIAFFSQYPHGIIPLTVFIKNVSDTIEDLDLDIELEIV